MRNTLRVLSVVSSLVIFASASVALAANNWVGTWELNVAASKFSPGPALKSETLKFVPVEGGIKLASHFVDANGKERKWSYVSTFDGKDVPWKGNPDADTSSPKRIDANSYENAWKKDGKVVINTKVVVSADGKTLTVTQVGTNAKGEAIDNTLVFDRH